MGEYIFQCFSIRGTNYLINLCMITFALFTRELYKHFVKETIIIPQHNDTDEQIDHVSLVDIVI